MRYERAGLDPQAGEWLKITQAERVAQGEFFKCPDREIQKIEFRVNQHTNY